MVTAKLQYLSLGVVVPYQGVDTINDWVTILGEKEQTVWRGERGAWDWERL